MQNVGINRNESIAAREVESKDTEVSLKSCVYGEVSGRLVHAGHVLSVRNLLQGQLVPVVPVSIIEMLSYQSVWLDS